MDAINAVTGHREWIFTPTSHAPDVTTDISIAGGRAFFTDLTGRVYGLSAKTGHKLWVNHLSADYSTPAVAGGRVYVGTMGDIVVLSAATGTKLWTKSVGSGQNCNATPAVGKTTVFIACDNNLVSAIGLPKHHLLWQKSIGPQPGGPTYPSNESSPAVAGGVVYLGAYLGIVYGLSAATGNVIWKFQTRQGVESSPAIVGDVVYVGSEDGNLYAFGPHGQTPPVPKQGCTGSKTVTCTFVTTGEHSFIVPKAVSSIRVVAIGAEGSPQVGVYGGTGAKVTATVEVTPGEKLFVEVGGNGRLPNAKDTGGGWNGGGSGGYESYVDALNGPGSGGGGGGATALQTCSTVKQPLCHYTGNPSTDPRLLVAGGGGGAGGFGFGCAYSCSHGGNAAGTSGAAGGTGAGEGDASPGGGGKGATMSGAGRGGSGTSKNGAMGSVSLGGAGTGPGVGGSGGGGGGGFFGGGGGGDGGVGEGGAIGTGGGGGAGSSYVKAGISSNVSFATDSIGLPLITITYRG